MHNRNRKISTDKKLINLYIKYIRDFVKDKNYIKLKAIREEDKFKIKIFKEKENISIYFLNDYKESEKEFEQETDKRIKKTKEKLFIKNNNKLKRYNEIKSIVDAKWLYNSNWEEASRITELIDDFSFTINNVEIYLTDLHQFDCDFHTIADFFKLDLEKKSTENIIFSIFQNNALEFLENYNLHKKLDLFIKYSEKIQRAVIRLKKNSYYKQSAKKALEKEPEGTDSGWLLKIIIEYEKNNGKKLTLKKDHLKSLLLYYIFENWFDLNMAKKIIKNSNL